MIEEMCDVSEAEMRNTTPVMLNRDELALLTQTKTNFQTYKEAVKVLRE